MVESNFRFSLCRVTEIRRIELTLVLNDENFGKIKYIAWIFTTTEYVNVKFWKGKVLHEKLNSFKQTAPFLLIWTYDRHSVSILLTHEQY